MKKLICSLLSIAFLTLLVVATTGSKAHAQDEYVSYQTFYDELSPYGQWINDPQYGDVWVPNEGSDFRPYGSNGYWVMTDYGNTWVSDDPFGWIVYHYGRWTYDPYYGWLWIPGYDWAPAWVSWRFGNGYCGWAPLGPDAYIGENYGCPDSWWVFMGPEYLYRRDHYNYWGDRHYNHEYINHTTIINNVYTDNGSHVRYNYGPRESTIEQVTHQRVPVYQLSRTSRPGQTQVGNHTVNIYRPSVNRATVSTARPSNVITAPTRISKPQNAPVNNNGQTGFRQAENRQNTVTNRQEPAPQNNRSQPQPAQQINRQQPAQQTRQEPTQPAQQNTGNRYFNHQPTPQQNNPQPQQHFTPPAPQPRQEPQRTIPQPQPQQHYNAPAPPSAPRPAPAPAPRGGGGRR